MDSNDQYVTDEQLLTLNATEGLDIIIVTAWPTRLLFVEVVSAPDDSFPDSNFRYVRLSVRDTLLVTSL